MSDSRGTLPGWFWQLSEEIIVYDEGGSGLWN